MNDKLPTKVGADQPAWLQKKAEKDTSLDGLRQYRRIPILRMVQALSPDELKDAYGEGSCVMMPNGVLVAKKEGSFVFEPLFTYTEFVQWADRKDSGSPPVVESTRNEQSQIARWSRSKEMRVQPYGDEAAGYKYSYVEHINFLGMVHVQGRDPELCVISLSKGEYATAAKFATSLVDLKAPLWATIWNVVIERHENRSGQKWWGMDFQFRDYVAEADAEAHENAYEDLKAGINAGEVGAAHDEAGADAEAKASVEFS